MLAGAAARRHRPLCLASVAYALLLAAWAIGNPPFAAPDEWAHHMRAIGMGRGHLLGERGEYPIPADASPLTVVQTRWANQAIRMVTVPAGTSPYGFDCNAFRPTASAACVDRVAVPRAEVVQPTPVGTYQPAPYLLPGLAIRLADDPQSANRLARVASALPCLFLLILAIVVATDRGRTPLALAGVLVATTPMVLFIASTVNGSGLESTAAIAFAAALGRVGRIGLVGRTDDGCGQSDDVRLAWLACGVAGTALALSRSTSALWTLVIAVMFVAATGVRPFVAAARRHAVPAALAGVGVLLGLALNRAWEAIYGPSTNVEVVSIDGAAAWALLLEVGRQLVGVFGTLDTYQPPLAYSAWLALTVVLIVLALAAGTLRERVALLGAVAFAIVAPLALQVALLVHTGFAVQGRHVLPVLATIPILAAEILVRRTRPQGSRPTLLLVPLLASVAATVQLVSWYGSARRQAVGTDGPWWFVPVAEWTPPLGWWPWLALAAAGCALLALSGVAATRARDDTAGSARATAPSALAPSRRVT